MARSDSGKPGTLHELKTLICSFNSLVILETLEEERAVALAYSAAAEAGLPVFEWTVTKGLHRTGENVPFHGTTDPLVMLGHIAGLTIEAVFILKDLQTYFDRPEVRRQVREISSKFAGTRSTLILIGAGIELPLELDSTAVRLEVRLPDSEELKGMVRELLQSLRMQGARFEIDLSPDQLEQLIRNLKGLTLSQARQVLAYAILQDGKLSEEDIQRVTSRKVESIRSRGLLEYYPHKEHQYALGGFGNLREWLQRARLGFSEEAKRLNLAPPKGILLVGVQGCGKSLAAKFVAQDWRLPLLKLEAGRLYDKYIGGSEQNLKLALRQAEAVAPVVLWIDELEKGFAAGGSDADGGVSMRLLGGFLTWLQEKPGGVFVVATANDVSSLPPELLRKGRFDEIFFVDLPDTRERLEILAIHLQLRNQDPSRFDMTILAGETEGFSGAELEQVVTSALLRALQERSAPTTEHLLRECRSTVPLSRSRKEDVSRFREWAAGRFVSVR